MRQMGLLCSERMLERDTKNFLKFFNEVKAETNQAAATLENVKKERAQA
jgi:serine/threonine-protein kinase RIO1